MSVRLSVCQSVGLSVCSTACLSMGVVTVPAHSLWFEVRCSAIVTQRLRLPQKRPIIDHGHHHHHHLVPVYIHIHIHVHIHIHIPAYTIPSSSRFTPFLLSLSSLLMSYSEKQSSVSCLQATCPFPLRQDNIFCNKFLTASMRPRMSCALHCVGLNNWYPMWT